MHTSILMVMSAAKGSSCLNCEDDRRCNLHGPSLDLSLVISATQFDGQAFGRDLSTSMSVQTEQEMSIVQTNLKLKKGQEK